MPEPRKFFITHSWQDIDFARQLCDDLKAHNLDGFFDAYSIQPGDDIADRIAHRLEECDVYVPLLSPAALESPWCEREIDAAIHLSMERERGGRPRIIPVIVTPCEIPVLLRSLLYISFNGRYEQALLELLTAFGVSTVDVRPKIVVPTTPTLESAPPKMIGKDGKEMILIPAGEFLMGSEEGDNEKPVHRVYVDGFYIDRYPVTNAEYKKFVVATSSKAPQHWANGQIPNGEEDHPVVHVSWGDAASYAKWVEGRLPTEAEWEKAASWDDVKKEKRRYPWGQEFDPGKCNTIESEIGNTTPVGKYSPGGDSAYGVGDIAGNVWEWCADWHALSYYWRSPGRNPMGPGSGIERSLRGGSWCTFSDYARCTYRIVDYPVVLNNVIGFRVAESFP